MGLHYVSLNICYTGDQFSIFSRIVTMVFQFVLMKWMPNLSLEEFIDHLCFDFNKVSCNIFTIISDKYNE